MTAPLLPSGQAHIALLPATTLTATASAPALKLVESTMPRYKYPVGKTVFVTRYAIEWDFKKRCVRRVPKESTAQIKSRTRLKNLRTGQYENWYTVFGFPAMYRESDVSLKARFYQPPQTRVQAVAVA